MDPSLLVVAALWLSPVVLVAYVIGLLRTMSTDLRRVANAVESMAKRENQLT